MKQCRPVEVPIKMAKSFITTVEVLYSWCKLVYVRETPYNAVFTAEML